jgi:hypothetical protein
MSRQPLQAARIAYSALQHQKRGSSCRNFTREGGRWNAADRQQAGQAFDAAPSRPGNARSPPTSWLYLLFLSKIGLFRAVSDAPHVALLSLALAMDRLCLARQG